MSLDLDNLIACQHCDALVKLPVIAPGEKALCPRCGSKLFSRKKNTVNRTLAIAFAGIVLFLPAILLPIIGVGAAGQYSEASLIQCIATMINDGYPIIAMCVFMFTITIPIIRLVSAFYVALSLKFKRIRPGLLVFFRSYHLLDSWAMVHVFFLGVVVSIYKLDDMADVSVGTGLISFIALLFCSTLVSITLDHHYAWEQMEKAIES